MSMVNRCPRSGAVGLGLAQSGPQLYDKETHSHVSLSQGQCVYATSSLALTLFPASLFVCLLSVTTQAQLGPAAGLCWKAVTMFSTLSRFTSNLSHVRSPTGSRDF